MSKCTMCSGTGKRTSYGTETEQDIPMGIALGTAMGIGYFPSTRTRSTTTKKKCTYCNGTGER